MTIEHWETEHSTFCTVKGVPESERVRQMSELDEGPATKCCEIEGETWDECMTKYHEHMEWKPYVPMSDEHHA